MKFKFIADQARQAVAEAHALYTPEEVYERIKRMAQAGRLWAELEANRWGDELTTMLSEDGYSVKFIRQDTAVLVTWGGGDRRLREGNDGCDNHNLGPA